jgi:hypothetical protein
MPPSQFRRAVAALASRYRWPRPGLGTAFLAAPILVASVLPLLVFAHEAHPAAPPAAVSAEERAFLEENEAAMTKMMNDMAAKPTGDIDRDFVAMMSPHHQGAIDMAVIELRYGKNEQLRRIAMKLAIGEPATDTTPAPTQPPSAPNTTVHHHPGMQMDVSTGMKK